MKCIIHMIEHLHKIVVRITKIRNYYCNVLIQKHDHSDVGRTNFSAKERVIR